MNTMISKIPFKGMITSVQPRIRLIRSFDQRYHNYLGYVLRIKGTLGHDDREFRVAVGEKTHIKHQFQVGQSVSGECLPVSDARMETAEYYKVSQLKNHTQPESPDKNTPPWLGVPGELIVYRERGHRRLSAQTYQKFCTGCIWGCQMPVEMIIDQWNPAQKKYRFETFCYGPKSCKHYKPGPTRKVPGRKGMTWEEPDWVDEEETAHRGPDD